jgi:hypothetical protein
MVRYVDGKIGEGGWRGRRVDDGWRIGGRRRRLRTRTSSLPSPREWKGKGKYIKGRVRVLSSVLRAPCPESAYTSSNYLEAQCSIDDLARPYLGNAVHT